MKGAQDRGRPPSLTPGGRVALDAVGRRAPPAGGGGPRAGPPPPPPRLPAGPSAPADVARRFLARHAPAFGWTPALADLTPAAPIRLPGAPAARLRPQDPGPT